MIAFWCFSSMGLLISMQHRCHRQEANIRRPSLLERERMLDEENRRLDEELDLLLYDYRSLIENRG